MVGLGDDGEKVRIAEVQDVKGKGYKEFASGRRRVDLLLRCKNAYSCCV